MTNVRTQLIDLRYDGHSWTRTDEVARMLYALADAWVAQGKQEVADAFVAAADSVVHGWASPGWPGDAAR